HLGLAPERRDLRRHALGVGAGGVAVQGDVVARAGHGQGEGAADPASGAGDQRHAAGGGSVRQAAQSTLPNSKKFRAPTAMMNSRMTPIASMDESPELSTPL